MNKLIIGSLFLLTSPLWALSTSDVIKQLDDLQGLKLDALCETCESQKAAETPAPRTGTFSPQDAIKDINSGKLVYMGRTLLPGHDQNLSCVYKSDTAYIIYNNCMGNKKESSATEIEVLSFEGGKSRFYIQNSSNLAPLSTLPRSEYDMVWTLEYAESKPPGKLNLPELKKYLERHQEGMHGYCYIGNTFKAKDMTQAVHCKRLEPAFEAEWKEKALSFWREPGEEWYKAKKYLRKTVLETKY